MKGKKYLIALIPGAFYTFIVSSYILHADLGFSLDSRFGFTVYQISYPVAFVFVLFFIWFVKHVVKSKKDEISKLDKWLYL